MRFTTKLLPSRTANLGILLLNHPKALHALTLDMVHCMQDTMGEWGKDDTLKAVLIKAAEAKRPAFCAGGDVKAVYENGLAADKQNDFFYQEYQVNHAIATSKIPFVSLWDGVVMGGGVGISIHGKYRVATENTLMAMPETAIGLFPDVGSMFWMNRLLSRPVANYLALVGKRIDASDLVYTGLATHYVPSKHLPDLETALMEATIAEGAQQSDDVVADVLKSFHEPVDTDSSFLATSQTLIDQTFNADTVEDIFANLEKGDTDFCKDTLASLKKLSPTALKVSLEGLRRGAAHDTIGQDLQMEYRMASACTRPGSDFYEGVRAVLVDRDNSPKWNPSSVEEVTKEMVDSFFSPLDEEWQIPEQQPSKL
jgi:3-hydroxyisobutyryl-CoA hydrolase